MHEMIALESLVVCKREGDPVRPCNFQRALFSLSWSYTLLDWWWNFLFVESILSYWCPRIVPSIDSWSMLPVLPLGNSRRKAESPTKVQDSFRVEWMVLPVRWNLQDSRRRDPRLWVQAGGLWYIVTCWVGPWSYMVDFLRWSISPTLKDSTSWLV